MGLSIPHGNEASLVRAAILMVPLPYPFRSRRLMEVSSLRCPLPVIVRRWAYSTAVTIMYGATDTTPGTSSQSRKLLDDSLAVSHETSNMADDVMGRLFGQRETLESAQFKLGDMREMTDDARIHLREMERKAFMKKICLYATIFILSILILLVAYREITNRGRLF